MPSKFLYVTVTRSQITMIAKWLNMFLTHAQISGVIDLQTFEVAH